MTTPQISVDFGKSRSHQQGLLKSINYGRMSPHRVFRSLRLSAMPTIILIFYLSFSKEILLIKLWKNNCRLSQFPW